MSRPEPSEPMTPDEIREHKKTMLRGRKAIEAMQSEIEATHLACWRLELRYPELYPALDDARSRCGRPGCARN
jgi:hypothetical protein